MNVHKSFKTISSKKINFSLIKITQKIKIMTFQGYADLLDEGIKMLAASSHTQFKLNRMRSSSSDKNVERSCFKVLLNKKALQIRQNLKRRHHQMIMIVTKLIKLMLCNGIFEAAFLLCEVLNSAVIL